MALIKSTLQLQIETGLKNIFLNQSAKASSGSESEDPADVISQISHDMAKVIADAVDSYVKSGDIVVGPDNIVVNSPVGTCVVTPAAPASMV